MFNSTLYSYHGLSRRQRFLVTSGHSETAGQKHAGVRWDMWLLPQRSEPWADPSVPCTPGSVVSGELGTERLVCAISPSGNGAQNSTPVSACQAPRATSSFAGEFRGGLFDMAWVVMRMHLGRESGERTESARR